MCLEFVVQNAANRSRLWVSLIAVKGLLVLMAFHTRAWLVIMVECVSLVDVWRRMKLMRIRSGSFKWRLD